jgi:outer membrane protein assembly factor BamB
MNSPTLLLLPILGALAAGADWPQWRGPDRTDISKETGLLATWPSDGPPLLWTIRDAGIGYSGVAVVGDRLYSLGAFDDKSHVYALDVGSGKRLWSTPLGPAFENAFGNGPRSTPTVDGDVLYALGGQSELICVELAGGKKRWSVNLKRDLGGQMMTGWGYCESPLIDGDKLICSPGGARGTLAALDKRTGKVLWRSTGLRDRAAYSSPIVTEVGGVRQYVQQTGDAVVGVAAADGALLWRHPRPEYRTAVIPTPIAFNGHVYATSGYGAGCDLIRLDPDGRGVAGVPFSNKNMVNHHGGVVLVGEHFYGYSDGKGWVCQDAKTGEIVWAERHKLGKGSVTFADGHLYCFSENEGTVVLVEATPGGWKEKGRFTIPEETSRRSQRGKIWTHPVVANGRLYLRDQDLLFCYNVKGS